MYKITCSKKDFTKYANTDSEANQLKKEHESDTHIVKIESVTNYYEIVDFKNKLFSKLKTKKEVVSFFKNDKSKKPRDFFIKKVEIISLR